MTSLQVKTSADVIDLWNRTESALQKLLGGSVLSGQPLIYELRQRGLITYDQANAASAFLDTKERAQRPGYQLTQTDIAIARDGYYQLNAELNSASPAAPARTSYVSGINDSDDMIMSGEYGTSRFSNKAMWAWIGIAAFCLLLVVAGWYAYGHRDSDDLSAAIEQMKSGQREAARAGFAKYAASHPDEAEPHVFLARLAREDGDEFTARREIDAAIRIAPNNFQALREMGLFLYSKGNYSLARSFFIRALRSNPTDPSAQGYLGCSLLKMNHPDEARRFLSRAGSGTWSTCTREFVP